MTSVYEDRTTLVVDVAIKSPCKAATTANIVLNGEQTIDGAACVAGDRVLVKAQTSSVDNGIYICSTSAWTRSTDFDGNRDAAQGTLVLVYQNTRLYKLTTASPVVIGTSQITFSGATDALGSINLDAGAVGAPTLIWAGDATSGFYRPGANQIGVAISGAQRGLFNSSGLTVTGSLTATTSVLTPIVDSGSGSLVLNGAGVTAITLTGANALFAGTLTFGAAVSKIIPGATSISLRTVADNADNLLMTDAGVATIRLQLKVGTSAATTGSLNVPYNQDLASRNQANSSDVGLIRLFTANSVTNVILIGDQGSSQSAGVILRARSGAGAPNTSDIGAGDWALWRDTSGATTKLYYNNAGAIIASAAFA